MAATPQFVKTPALGMARISTANTNLNGTGTLATLVTGATPGTRVTRIEAIATGATTAGFVRVFMSNGADTHFYKQMQVSAITPSASTPAWEGFIDLDDCVLPDGWLLRVATHNAEGFDVKAFGGTY